MNTQEIVSKLWSMCDVLRDDGITYQDYVTELTYLLFLKMMQETDQEKELPNGYRWSDLVGKEGVEQLNFYRELLVHLGTKGEGRVQAIFNNANSSLKKPRNLLKLVTDIDALDWYSARTEGLGDLYEGLLEKNANEKKSGAGQYFTPRPLIESMVNVTKPQPGEVIQDPAAGTGGFLTHADRYMKDQTDNYFDLPNEEQKFQTNKAFHAVELVDDTHRLLLMNVMLHGMDGTYYSGDTMGDVGKSLQNADVILTNPPFGTKKGGGITRDDFTYTTSNKQLCFLQHIYRGLQPGGRAAVVLPDNVLFEEGVGTKIRADLMDKCNLHTVLRLPTGIFYAQGVKTNVLFFTRGKTDSGNTKAVWFYDMRTNMPQFGKRTPLTLAHFAEFEKCYGKKADGSSKRADKTVEGSGEESRFRSFSREEIVARGDNLDISWLKDEDATSGEDLEEPEVIAAQIKELLGEALGEIDALGELLESTGRQRWETAELAKYEAKGKKPPKNWRDKYKEPEPVDDSELPELPAGWCWVRVGDVLEVTSGFAFKSAQFSDKGVPVVKIANVSYGRFVWKQQQFLDESLLDANSNFIVKGGDTLLALTRPITENRLKACIYPDDGPPALLNQRVAMLRAFAPEISLYLTSMLHTDFFKNLVSSLLSETLQPNLSPVDLESALIPLAPIREQSKIVSAVTRSTKVVESLVKTTESLNICLTQLDQSILSKAFKGELVRQDPNDEPASELLARIRTTREAQATKKKAGSKKKLAN